MFLSAKYKTDNADTMQPVENEGGEDGVEDTNKVEIDGEGEEGENEETEGSFTVSHRRSIAENISL